MFRMKRELRDKHLKRRRTLRAQGVVITHDKLPAVGSSASEDDESDNGSGGSGGFDMKNQFKKFGRRLTILAHQAD